MSGSDSDDDAAHPASAEESLEELELRCLRFSVLDADDLAFLASFQTSFAVSTGLPTSFPARCRVLPTSYGRTSTVPATTMSMQGRKLRNLHRPLSTLSSPSTQTATARVKRVAVRRPMTRPSAPIAVDLALPVWWSEAQASTNKTIADHAKPDKVHTSATHTYTEQDFAHLLQTDIAQTTINVNTEEPIPTPSDENINSIHKVSIVMSKTTIIPPILSTSRNAVRSSCLQLPQQNKLLHDTTSTWRLSRLQQRHTHSRSKSRSLPPQTTYDPLPYENSPAISTTVENCLQSPTMDDDTGVKVASPMKMKCDITQQRVQRLPLEVFDDPEEDHLMGLANIWKISLTSTTLEKPIVMFSTPLRAYSKFVGNIAAMDIVWRPCLALGYDHARSVFLIQWCVTGNDSLAAPLAQKRVSRLNLLFEIEDRDRFYLRLERAVLLRAQFENQQAYEQAILDTYLKVESMPTSVEERVNKAMETFVNAYIHTEPAALLGEKYYIDTAAEVLQSYMNQMRDHYVFCMKRAYIECVPESTAAIAVREKRLKASHRGGNYNAEQLSLSDFSSSSYLSIAKTQTLDSTLSMIPWRFHSDFVSSRFTPQYINDAAKRLSLFLFTGNAEIQAVMQHLYTCLFDVVLTIPSQNAHTNENTVQQIQHNIHPLTVDPFVKVDKLSPFPLPYYILQERMIVIAEASKVKLGMQWPRAVAEHILGSLAHVFNFATITKSHKNASSLPQLPPSAIISTPNHLKPPLPLLTTTQQSSPHPRSATLTRSSKRAFEFLRLVDMMMGDQLRHVVSQSLIAFLQLFGMYVIRVNDDTAPLLSASVQQRNYQQNISVPSSSSLNEIPRVVRETFQKYDQITVTSSTVHCQNIRTTTHIQHDQNNLEPENTDKKSYQERFSIYSPLSVPALIPIVMTVYIWLQDNQKYPPTVNSLGNLVTVSDTDTVLVQQNALRTGQPRRLTLLPSTQELQTLLWELFILPVSATIQLVPQTHRSVLHHLYITAEGVVPSNENIETLGTRDSDLMISAQQALNDLVQRVMPQMESIVQKYCFYEYLLNDHETQQTAWEANAVDWTELDKQLKEYYDASMSIEALSTEVIELRPFLLDVSAIKRLLLGYARTAHSKLSAFIQHALVSSIDAITRLHEEIENRLLANVHANLQAWLYLSQYLDNEFSTHMDTLESLIVGLKHKGELLQRHRILLLDNVSKQYWQAQGSPQRLKDELERTRNRIADAKQQTIAQVGINRNYINTSTLDYEAELTANYIDISSTSIKATSYLRNTCRRVQSLRARLDKVAALVREVRESERVLCLPGDDMEMFQPLCAKFEHYEAFWTLCYALTYDVETWKETLFEKIDPALISSSLMTWLSMLDHLLIAFQNDVHNLEAVYRLKSMYESFSRYKELICFLRNPYLVKRHWLQLTHRIGINASDMTVMTLRQVLALELELVLDIISEVSQQATREHDIETTLDQLRNQLAGHTFEINGTVADNCVAVMNFDIVREVFDDVQVQVQRLLVRSGIEGIRTKIEVFLQNIGSAHQILGLWSALQDIVEKVHYVIQSIQNHQHIDSEQQQGEQKSGPPSAFLLAIKTLQILSGIVERNNTFVLLILRVDLLRILTSLNMQEVTQTLANFANSKQKIYPRLAFLTPEEVVELYTSCSKDVTAVNAFVPPMFPGLHCLIIKDAGAVRRSRETPYGVGLCTVIGVQATNMEQLELRNEIVADGPLEIWLSKVERAICETMKLLLLRWLPKGLAVFSEGIQVPSQLVLLLRQISTTQLLSKLLADPLLSNRESLQQLQREYDLVGTHIKFKVTSHCRRSYENILLYLHRAISVTAPMKASADSKHASQQKWETEPHFFVSPDGNVCCKIVTLQMDYGFNFLGDVRTILLPSNGFYLPRIVDSIQQCLFPMLSTYISLLPFLREIVSEFAQTVGKSVTYFPCNKLTNSATLDRIITASLATQIWCCVENVDSLSSPVFGSLMNLLLELQRALHQRRRDTAVDIILRGVKYDTSTTLVCFACSSDIVPRLQPYRSLFRRVAIATPIFVQPLEVMLFAAGLRHAYYVAQRLHSLTVYINRISQLRSCLMTSEAICRVIHGLYSTQQMHSKNGQAEFEEIARALYNDLIPHVPDAYQIVTINLFQAFGVSISDNCKSSLLLPQVIVDQIGANHQLLDPVFAKKCMQAVEALHTWRKLIIIGLSLSGKSSLIDIVRGAITSLSKQQRHDSLALHRFYTAALPLEAVFKALQDLVSKCQDAAIIALDGPLVPDTSLLFEQLALNHAVALPTGGLLRLSRENLFMVFETTSIEHLSPAAVAQCPLLYLPPLTDDIELILERTSKASIVYRCCQGELMRAFVIAIARPLLADLCVSSHLPFHLALCMSTMFRFADSLYMGLQSGSFERLTPAEAETWYFAALLFSLLWTLPQHLQNTRSRIDTALQKYWHTDVFINIAIQYHLEFIVTKLVNFPPEASVFDVYFDIVSLTWKCWKDYPGVRKLPPDLYPGAIPLVSSLSHIIQHTNRCKLHMLLHGPAGCGKSSFAVAAIDAAANALGKDAMNWMHLHISQHWNSRYLPRALLSHLIKRGRGRMGTINGRPLLCLLDDLQALSTANIGNHEQLRQLIEESSVFSVEDMSRITVEQLKLIAVAADIREGQIPERLLNKLLVIHMPIDEETHMHHMSDHCLASLPTRMVIDKSGQVVSTLLRTIIMATRKLHLALKTSLSRAYRFNTQKFATILHCLSIAANDHECELGGVDRWLHLWGHAAFRIYADALSIEHMDIFCAHLSNAYHDLPLSFEQVFDTHDPILYLRLAINRRELIQTPPFERQLSLQQLHHNIQQQHQITTQLMATMDFKNATPMLLYDHCRLSYTLETFSNNCTLICDLEYPVNLLAEVTASVLSMTLCLLDAREADLEVLLKSIYRTAFSDSHSGVTLVVYDMRRCASLSDEKMYIIASLLNEGVPLSWFTSADVASVFRSTQPLVDASPEESVTPGLISPAFRTYLYNAAYDKVKVVIITNHPLGFDKTHVIRCCLAQSVRRLPNVNDDDRIRARISPLVDKLSKIAISALHDSSLIKLSARELDNLVAEGMLLMIPNNDVSDNDTTAKLQIAQKLKTILLERYEQIQGVIQEDKVFKQQLTIFDMDIKSLDHAISEFDKSIAVAKIAVNNKQRQVAELVEDLSLVESQYKEKLTELHFKLDSIFFRVKLLKEDDLFEIKTILHPSDELCIVCASVCRLLGFVLAHPYIWEDIRRHLFDSNFLTLLNGLSFETCDLIQLSTICSDAITLSKTALLRLTELSEGADVLGTLVFLLCQHSDNIKWVHDQRQLSTGMLKQINQLQAQVREQLARLTSADAERQSKHIEYDQLRANKKATAELLITTTKQVRSNTSHIEPLQAAVQYVSERVVEMEQQEQHYMFDRLLCCFMLQLGGLLSDIGMNNLIVAWQQIIREKFVAGYVADFWRLLSTNMQFNLQYMRQGALPNDYLIFKTLISTRPHTCMFVYDPDDVFVVWYKSLFPQVQTYFWSKIRSVSAVVSKENSGHNDSKKSYIDANFTWRSIGPVLIDIVREHCKLSYDEICERVLNAGDNTDAVFPSLTIVLHRWDHTYSSICAHHLVDFSLSQMSDKQFENLVRVTLLSCDNDRRERLKETASDLWERLVASRAKTDKLFTQLTTLGNAGRVADLVTEFKLHQDTEKINCDLTRPIIESIHISTLYESKLSLRVLQHVRTLYRISQTVQNLSRVSSFGFLEFIQTVHGCIKSVGLDDTSLLLRKLNLVFLSAVDSLVQPSTCAHLRLVLLLLEAEYDAENEQAINFQTIQTPAKILQVLGLSQVLDETSSPDYRATLAELQILLPIEFQPNTPDAGKKTETVPLVYGDATNFWELLKGAQFRNLTSIQKLLWVMLNIPSRLLDTVETFWEENIAITRRAGKSHKQGGLPKSRMLTAISQTPPSSLSSYASSATTDLFFQIHQMTQQKSVENVTAYAFGQHSNEIMLPELLVLCMAKGKTLAIIVDADSAAFAYNELERMLIAHEEKKPHPNFSIWFVRREALVFTNVSSALYTVVNASCPPMRISNQQSMSGALSNLVRISEKTIFSDSTTSLLGWDLLLSLIILWLALDQLTSSPLSTSPFATSDYDTFSLWQLMVNVRGYLLKQPEAREHKSFFSYIARHMMELKINNNKSIIQQHDLKILWSDVSTPLVPVDPLEDKNALLLQCHSLARTGDYVQLRNMLKAKFSSDLWEKVATPLARPFIRQYQRFTLHDLRQLLSYERWDLSIAHSESMISLQQIKLNISIESIRKALMNEEVCLLMAIVCPVSEQEILSASNRQVNEIMRENIRCFQALVILMKSQMRLLSDINDLEPWNRFADDQLCDTIEELSRGSTPKIWLKHGFPTQMFGLDGWLILLCRKIQYVVSWYNMVQSGKQVIMHDCSKVFDPRALLTAMVVDYAIQFKDVVDELEWDILVLSNIQVNMPDRGYYLSGFYLDNAVWDSLHNQLKEPSGLKQFYAVPCIWFKPSVRPTTSLVGPCALSASTVSNGMSNGISSAAQDRRFQCPIFVARYPYMSPYHTTYRLCLDASPALMSADAIDSLWLGYFNLSTIVPSRHWILQSVAFLLEIPPDTI